MTKPSENPDQTTVSEDVPAASDAQSPEVPAAKVKKAAKAKSAPADQAPAAVDEATAADGTAAHEEPASPSTTPASHAPVRKSHAHPARKAPRPAHKESFYAMVADPTDPTKTVFVNVSEHLGRPWPFAKPQATCAVRVGTGTVAFTMLILTKKTVSKLVATPVLLPRGPLSRLERRATRYADMDTTTLVVETGLSTAKFIIERDENKVASLEMTELVTRLDPAAPKAEGVEELEDLFAEDTAPEPDASAMNPDGTFELPKSSVQVSIYLRSPRVQGYVLALGFIHHFGKAGDTESIARLAAKSLSLATQLGDFRLLAGIESVEVPPAINRANYLKARSKKVSQPAQGVVDLQLFKDPEGTLPPELVAKGEIAVDIDLAHINQASGRLLFKYVPKGDLVGFFEPYRNIVDIALSELLRERIGIAEIEQIIDEVVLGMVTTTSVDALRNALRHAGTFNLTPSLIQRQNS